MPFSFFARDNGRAHACGHRGFSQRYPENTIAAFDATKAHGGTTVEIDVVLSSDGAPFVLHDLTLDRTTNGHGFVADHSDRAIAMLDAGGWFDPHFEGEPVPGLGDVLKWAVSENMGLVVEIKERERTELALERCAELVREAGAIHHVQVLSFNHVDMKRLKAIDPEIRTELITHARHADLVSVLRAADADSVSIELGMFDPEDGKALHDAGLCNRVHMPRPEILSVFWRHGRDPLPRIRDWLAAGVIDTLSGDDVPFIRRLIDASASS
ncbi:MAG: glycerophosphodiester phosphodiesterase family protein [Pseudomonadota bacterium]